VSSRASRDVALFVAYRGLSRSFLFAPYMLHFATGVRGLSLAEFGALKGAYYFAVTLLEVPTGVFADRIGRRAALVLGALLSAAGCVAAALAHSLAGFALSDLCFGLGTALMGGADSALVYDALAAERRESEYPRAEAWALASWMGITAIGMPLSDLFLVHDGDPVGAYWAAAALMTLAVPCALAMREAPRAVHTVPATAREITRDALRDVFRVPGLLRLIAYSMGVFVLLRAASQTIFNPTLAALGVPVNRYGLVLALANVAGGIAALGSARALRGFGERACLVAMPLVLVSMYVGLALATGPWGAAFFVVQGAVFGAYPVVVRTLMNRLAPSAERRATVLSAESTAARLYSGVVLTGTGFALASLPLAVTLLGTAAAGCLPFLAMPWLRRSSRASA